MKHGDSRSRLYREWCSMKDRCLREGNKGFKNYGGRGITICPEWRDSFESFRDWSMENGYQDDLTLDRIDNDGPYSPENCRWISNQEQQNNRRNNHLLTHNGKTQTIAQWSRETGLEWMVIYDRIRNGWTTERALTEPLHINSKSAK